jgi:hypothetical protein
MARPRKLRGVNKVCAQCELGCKQSADAELVSCPLFRAPPPDPAKLAKPLREGRRVRYIPGAANRSGRFR